MISEPDYYKSNGLSPIGAFKQGLISVDEYRGFLIGNIIKYTIRAGKKEDAVKDLNKAKNYLDFYLELLQKDYPDITLEVNNDIDMDKFEEDIFKALEESKNKSVIMKRPTDNLDITKLDLSDVLYGEDGELKPMVREKLREYLLKRREKQ